MEDFWSLRKPFHSVTLPSLALQIIAKDRVVKKFWVLLGFAERFENLQQYQIVK